MDNVPEQIKPAREPPDKPEFHSIKTSLKSVARNPVVVSKLNDVVFMSHKIVIHTLQFIKLYLIDLIKILLETTTYLLFF